MAWNSLPPAPRNACFPSIADLLQRLEAIGHEARAGDVDPAHAVLRQRQQRVARVGLEPLGASEARLERDGKLLRPEPQLGGEKARGLVALAVVGIAQVERAPRQAVKAQHQDVRATVAHPVVVDALRERLDVAGIVVEAVDRAQPRHPPRLRGRGRTASNADAVALAEYCGNSGTTRMRSQPAARSAVDRRGRPDCRSASPSSTAHESAGKAGVLQALAEIARAAASSASRCARASGEPSLLQIIAYFFADCAGRVRRITPCRISIQTTRGISTTRGSDRNSAR